jgi:arginase
VHQIGLEVFDIHRRDGHAETMQAALAGLDRNTHLHVSFDVDFDPEIAPGVGTTVPGSSYRESHGDDCRHRRRSVDVMELNPAFDRTQDGRGRRPAGLLFGKGTLAPADGSFGPQEVQ